MRSTSYGPLTSALGKREITMTESVRGVGETTIDAIQSVLDNMERRCAQIRLELLELRRERL